MRGEVHDDTLSRMSITVAEVRVTPDLRIARAFVMPLGGRDTEIAMEALNRKTGELRHLVAHGLGLRFAPELKFQLDTTFDAMDNARRMFADPRVQADIAKPDADDDGIEAPERDDET